MARGHKTGDETEREQFESLTKQTARSTTLLKRKGYANEEENLQ